MAGHFLPALRASLLNQKCPASLIGALPVGHLEEHVFRVANLVPDVQEALLLLIGLAAERQARQGKVSGSAPPSLSSARRESGKGPEGIVAASAF